jgi:ribosome biogenesis protein Tsr3
MKYNKVRGILRAKHGSQVPKLFGGNPINYGAM